MRGARPKPTARRRLEGTRARPFNPAEPILPATVDVSVPDELAADPRAAAEWSRLLPLLQRARVITDGDRASLIALCQQWGRYLAAVADVAVRGMVITTGRGRYPMPNPLIGISNKALANCVRLWVELGLTPSARSRVATAPGSGGPVPDDAFAEFDDPPSLRH